MTYTDEDSDEIENEKSGTYFDCLDFLGGILNKKEQGRDTSKTTIFWPPNMLQRAHGPERGNSNATSDRGEIGRQRYKERLNRQKK